MLSARYDDGSAMSDREIRDQLLTIVFAGHETSGIALAWAINWLERTPPCATDCSPSCPRWATTRRPRRWPPRRTSRRSAIETLRLYPVVGEVVRLLRAPLALAAWTIPAGVAVSAGIALVHARADLYPRPEAFRPERIPRAEVRAPRVPAVRRRRAPLHRRRVRPLRDEGCPGHVAVPHRFTLAREEPERPVMRNLAMGPKRRVSVTASPRRLRSPRHLASPSRDGRLPATMGAAGAGRGERRVAARRRRAAPENREP